MTDETVLVTGAMGCIGAWTLRLLVAEGASVVAADLSADAARPRLLMSEDDLVRIRWRRLDVTDGAAVSALVADEGVNRIVHLAGLQVPFCKADPALGAAVNVAGTVNVFEAARANGVRGLAYASSLAVLGPPEMYPTRPVPDDCVTAPATLYGVYKLANEQTARVYAADWGVGSIGLRPYNVYGVGRDQGMTADIAKAVLATAARRPFHIRYGGPVALQHASDVARIFIACARAGSPDARVFNLRNDVTDVETFIALLTRLHPHARVSCETKAPRCPIPPTSPTRG